LPLERPEILTSPRLTLWTTAIIFQTSKQLALAEKPQSDTWS
jgi:hypothetical protein